MHIFCYIHLEQVIFISQICKFCNVSAFFYPKLKEQIKNRINAIFVFAVSCHEREGRKMRKIATHSLHTLQSKRNTYYQFSLAAIVISQIAHIQNFVFFIFPFEFPCRSFSCEHKYSGKIIFPFHAAATVRIYLNIPLFWQLCYNNKMAGMGSFLEDFSEQL